MYNTRPRRQRPLESAGSPHGQPTRLPDHVHRFVEGVQNALSTARHALKGRYPNAEGDLPVHLGTHGRLYDMLEMIAAYPVLRFAAECVRRNGETPGVNGETYYSRIQAPGLDDCLNAIRKSIRKGTYQFQPLRRIKIPKASGGHRIIDIPTIGDRIVETAMAIVLYRWCSPNWSPCSFGYRPGITLHQVIDAAEALTIPTGRSIWLLADLKDAFGSIPHQAMLEILKKDIPHEKIHSLVNRWLRQDSWRNQSGRRNQGIPQGSPFSPFVLNLFLDKVLDQVLVRRGIPFIRFADDLLFPCQTEAEAHDRLDWLIQQLRPWGLKVNDEKTIIADINCEKLSYLGFLIASTGSSLKLDIDPDLHLTNLNAELRFRATLNPASDLRDFNIKQLDQTAQARMVIEGWLQHYAPAISSGRLQQVIKRIKAKLIELQISGITSSEIKAIWTRAIERTAHEEHQDRQQAGDQVPGMSPNTTEGMDASNTVLHPTSSPRSIPGTETETGIETGEEHKEKKKQETTPREYPKEDDTPFFSTGSFSTQGLTRSSDSTPIVKTEKHPEETEPTEWKRLSLNKSHRPVIKLAYAETGLGIRPKMVDSDDAASGHLKDNSAQHAVLWSFDGSELLPDPVQVLEPSAPRRPGPIDQDWALRIV